MRGSRHRLAALLAGATAALSLASFDALAQRDVSAPTASIWTTTRFPQDQSRDWWDATWWERGILATAATNFEVKSRTAGYRSGDTDVPATVLSPQGKGSFPVVVFLHGRRGVDEVTRLVPLRLAARGFTVVVPDLYSARFIEAMPVKHDPATEEDAARAIDFALNLPEARGQSKTCVVSHTRGGYYTLKALVTHGRQTKVACVVAYYPHWQHPEAPEAAQVYQYAPEIERLEVPTRVYMGEHEQYQRARQIAAAVDAMRSLKRDVALTVYPGVGRGFEFRGPDVRTFADDLAAKDAMLRSAEFIGARLGAAR